MSDHDTFAFAVEEKQQREAREQERFLRLVGRNSGVVAEIFATGTGSIQLSQQVAESEE